MATNFIHLIADYGVGDPAFTEVIQKLTLLNSDVKVIPTSVPKFSTLATGFWIYQFAMVNPVPGMVIYANTAPRRDNRGQRKENEGEKLTYGRLNNGVEIISVNSGYCFSFVKPELKQLNLINVLNYGSQFRSRDFYPEAVTGIIQKKLSLIDDRMKPHTIPDIPANRIVWIDGYGNLKTSIRSSTVNFKPGQPVLIELNGIKRTAFATGGTFAVREGELAFAPGSSGANDKFMEIFLRGLSAWQEFGKPELEAEFNVTPI